MLSVYLLRHGETHYNASGNRYCGRTDINLTAKGMQQAEGLRMQLEMKQLDAVYSSPLIRARHTAELATGMQVNTDSRLIEVDFGNWEGKTKEEFILEDAALWNAWLTNTEDAKAGGNGETGRDVVQRVDDFYNDMLTKHRGGTIVVVGHNGINRLYLAHKLGMPLKNYRRLLQENSAITFFELDDRGEILIKKLNA